MSKYNRNWVILSKSFKKESMQKCFPLNYWLVEQINLPDDASR